MLLVPAEMAQSCRNVIYVQANGVYSEIADTSRKWTQGEGKQKQRQRLPPISFSFYFYFSVHYVPTGLFGPPFLRPPPIVTFAPPHTIIHLYSHTLSTYVHVYLGREWSVELSLYRPIRGNKGAGCLLRDGGIAMMMCIRLDRKIGHRPHLKCVL